MTILEDLGLEVNIIVNDSPLQEYEDKGADLSDDGFGDETCKCRCYVEVDGDTEFGVQLHVTPNNSYLDGNKQKRLRFCLDLDGQEEVEARLMDLARTPVLLDGQDKLKGETYVSRRFRFTTISTGTYPKALVLVREMFTFQQSMMMMQNGLARTRKPQNSLDSFGSASGGPGSSTHAYRGIYVRLPSLMRCRRN